MEAYMLDYTVCFIKQESKILLLNRDFPSWMGVWNGVGGKLEEGETPRESVIREILEETGLEINNPIFKGITTWFVGSKCVGGMYVYLAELPAETIFHTPTKTYEGILDWKDYEWIMNPKNKGIASDIPATIEYITLDKTIFEHRCFYNDEKLVEHQLIKIQSDYEMLDKKKFIEEEHLQLIREGRGIR
jgi:8-oxo-dGTP diphosphatase